MTDQIYDKAKTLFPVREASAETIQLRKDWIREALKTLISSSVREIKVPFQTKGSLDAYICKKLTRVMSAPKARRSGGRPRGRKPKPSRFDSKLM